MLPVPGSAERVRSQGAAQVLHHCTAPKTPAANPACLVSRGGKCVLLHRSQLGSGPECIWSTAAASGSRDAGRCWGSSPGPGSHSPAPSSASLQLAGALGSCHCLPALGPRAQFPPGAWLGAGKRARARGWGMGQNRISLPCARTPNCSC